MLSFFRLYYIQFKEAKILWGPDVKAVEQITQTPLKGDPVLITFTLILAALWVSNLKMDRLNYLTVSVSFIVYCNYSLFEINLQRRLL